ncbi:PPC domain-containing protein [Cystobacter fuscus]|uniref:PPC domain-containing protein n=1 Tax=Cystobacter fuscus TaxID=43 RepID=UPI0037BEEBCB
MGLISCSGDNNEPVQTPCEGVACGPGRCEVSDDRPVCACDPGHHAEGLTCLRDGTPPFDPCAPNPCMHAGRGQCSNVQGQAVCACDPGKVEDGSGQCVSLDACEPNPCTAPYKTNCSVVEGQPVCACVSGYVPQGEACVLSVPDDHGDTPSAATPVTPSSTSVGAILHATTDVDVFSFEAAAGHVYELACNTSAFDCDLVLLNALGTVVASDTTNTTYARVRVELNTPGTYFFRIEPGGSTVGAYTYRLQDLGVDDHGDTLATATPITPGTSGVPAQFEVSRDEDWFSFTATAGRLYDFTCSTASIDCDVYLLDAHGNVVAADTTSTTVTRVRRKFTTGGTFSYRVVANSGWNVSYTSYTYRLQDLGVDDHGDTQATATPITPSASWVPAQFEVSRDEDWFSFTATAGRLYEFSCSTASIDCDLYLLDSEGKVIVANTTSTSTTRVRWRPTTGGTFSYRVVAASGWNVSYTSYSYQLQDLGVDDHADTFSGATVLTPGTATSGNLELSGDVDFFEVSLAASTAYSVTTTGSSTTLTVYATDKTTVLSTGASPRAFTSNAAGGAHYVRVSGSTTGAYTVKVQ